MACLPFSASATNPNFNAGLEDPYRSGVVSENPIGIGLFEDDGFEIFDPRGLFSPRRRLSVEDARFNSSHQHQQQEQHQQHQASLKSTIEPIQVSVPISSPIIQSPNASSPSPSCVDEFDPSILLDFNSTIHKSNSPPSSRPWSLITQPNNEHLTSSPTIDDFININQLDAHSDSLPPNSVGLATFDGGGHRRSTSPIDFSPISPCSSTLYRSQSGSSAQEPLFNAVASPPMIPRGRSTLRRFVFEARPTPHHTSPSPQPSNSIPSRTGISSNQSPTRPHVDPHVHSHHHRPTPIMTCRLPCGTRDTSLPTRLRCIKSPEDLSASVSSMAYSEMASSPAVDFLSAFADSTVPVSRTHQNCLNEDPPGMFNEGDTVAGHILGPIIGRGGFSIVREAIVIESGRRVAVKIVRHASPSPVGNIPTDRSNNQMDMSFSPASVHHSGHPPPCASFRDRASSTPIPFDSYLVKSAHLPLPTSVTESLATALLKREIDIWSALKAHPHLVPLLSIHRALHQTFIFMPLCDGGNLLQMLNVVKAKDSGPQPPSTCENSSGTGPQSPSQFLSHFSRASCPSSCFPLPSGLDLGVIRHIFGQIVHGLRYLHLEAGVTHKDIKLENILIHEGKIMISDFGLAVYPSHPYRTSTDSLSRDLSLPKHLHMLPRIKEGHPSGGSVALSRSVRERRRRLPRGNAGPVRFASFSQFAHRDDSDGSSSSDDVLPTAAGSLAYTPPEQLRSDVPLTHPSLDIWALGCVLYALLEGNLPFQDDFEPRLRLKIMNGQFCLPSLLTPTSMSGLSVEEEDERKKIANLLKGCLAVDQNARWTIEQIVNSGWITPELEANKSSSCSSSSTGRSLRQPIESSPSNLDSPVDGGNNTPRATSGLGGATPLAQPEALFPALARCEFFGTAQPSSPAHGWASRLDLRHLLAHVSPTHAPHERGLSSSPPTSPCSPTHERLSRSVTREVGDRHQHVGAYSHRRSPSAKTAESLSPSNSRSRTRARLLH